MRVLVTGGNGYLGSVLVQELVRSGHEPIINDIVESSTSDYWREKALLRLGNCVEVSASDVDAVVHLAAIVGEDACKKAGRDKAVAENVENVKTMIERCKGKQFIFASTCSNYGRIADGRIADELSPLDPQGLYAETK